jgi:hypothetical protein
MGDGNEFVSGHKLRSLTLNAHRLQNGQINGRRNDTFKPASSAAVLLWPFGIKNDGRLNRLLNIRRQCIGNCLKHIPHALARLCAALVIAVVLMVLYKPLALLNFNLSL